MNTMHFGFYVIWRTILITGVIDIYYSFYILVMYDPGWDTKTSWGDMNDFPVNRSFIYSFVESFAVLHVYIMIT